ncbi:MAG: hypothetical protein HC886_01950 [Leptolyngbyaceae cyanobacterium SM1_1_3]|nr:hypothetical protein [Leptolyngbyaceae cyanobacterium SM1_1_3]
MPEAPGASCLATVLRAGQLKTFVFTPKKQTLALIPRSQWLGMSETILAIAGAFVWGALHSMSPGHGKTLVGAYLIGERATPLHAVILAATTTITHTLGIFALGLVALFATRYVVPETLYPWMSLISGSMVVGIGFNLLMTRWRRDRQRRPELNASGHNHVHTDHEHADHGHSHSHSQAEHSHTGHGHTERSHVHTHHGDAEPGHSHELLHPAIPVLATSAQEHSHPHPHKYSYSHPIQSHNVLETAHANPPHTHSHAHSGHHSHAGGHSHSHLPSGADGSPVTWRSLLALGISGGLIPCPAALVLLLSAIAFGNIALGLSLVVAFSLGLAVVLTSLGLLLVYGRQFFKRVPTQSKAMRLLPTVSALSIFLLGLGISTRAMLQIFA